MAILHEHAAAGAVDQSLVFLRAMEGPASIELGTATAVRRDAKHFPFLMLLHLLVSRECTVLVANAAVFMEPRVKVRRVGCLGHGPQIWERHITDGAD